MKLVAVVGSPHGMEGITGGLTGAAVDAAEAAGAEVACVALEGPNVQACIDCSACITGDGLCVLEDGLSEATLKLREADCIILASPTYFAHVSGQMKCFLDRQLSGYFAQDLRGKYGAVITTASGMGHEEAAAYLSRYLNLMGVAVADVLAVAGLTREAALTKETLGRAAKLGRGLVAAAQARTSYPEQDELIRHAFDEAVGAVRSMPAVFRYAHPRMIERGWIKA